MSHWKTSLLAVVVIVAFVCSGCTSTMTTPQSNLAPPRLAEIPGNAKYELLDNIEGESTTYYILGVFPFSEEWWSGSSKTTNIGGGVTTAEKIAAYKAVYGSNSDTVLCARWNKE